MYGSISLYFPFDRIFVEQKKVYDMRKEKTGSGRTKRNLDDPKINIKVMLAAFWISQFLLWTFGDMVSLLQDLNEPVGNGLLAFVAAPLALVQVGMILFTLGGKAKFVRWANLCITPVFILFNIGFLFGARFGWEFILGAGYLLMNVLTILYAWKWPRIDNEKVGGI
jgi:hypothetical protein